MRVRDLFLMLALAAIWGSSYLFIRVAVPSLGPLVVGAARVVIGGLGLVGFAVLMRRRNEVPGIDRRYLILGMLNAAVPYGLIALAELHLTASFAGILNATTPLFTALVVAGWQRERLTGRKVVGLLIGFAGVAVLVGWNPAPLSGWLTISIVAMLVASLSYAVATVYAKRSLTRASALSAAIGQQFGGAVFLLPLGAIALSTGSSDTTPTVRVALAMLALGLLCTSVAYLLYFHLIATVGAMNTSSVTFLIPVFGVIWSAIFLGEHIRPEMIVGLVLILCSVGLVTGIRLPIRGAGRTDRTPQPSEAIASVAAPVRDHRQ